jgi:hypothetical protein
MSKLVSEIPVTSLEEALAYLVSSFHSKGKDETKYTNTPSREVTVYPGFFY